MMERMKGPRMAGGRRAGMVAPAAEATMPNLRARMMRPGGMARGGKVHDDAAMDRKLIREEIDKAHKKMGMKKGGAVKMAAGGKVRGDGACSKGKTKGRFV